MMAASTDVCPSDGVSLSSVSLNGMNGATKSGESDTPAFNDDLIKTSGFNLEELYRLALKFYKDKEGTKAFQISYSDRLRLVALTKQITYGKFCTEASSDVGFLDVVGNDRSKVWQSLGDMTSHDGMKEFVERLTALCPPFTLYIKAHKAEREEMEKIKNEEIERLKEEESEKKKIEDDIMKEEKRLKFLKIEQQIKEALNQQTAIQFRQYAKQQAPDNPEQQETLIVQLQDQHFQQYIQQTHSQQLVHQRQQYAQLQALTRNDGDESQNPEQLIIPPSIPLLQDSEAQQTIEYVSEGTGSQEERLENGGPLLEKESETSGQEKDTDIDTAQQEREINLEDETAFNDKIDSDREDDDLDPPCYPLPGMPPLIPASLWTRSDIREFKESVRKNPDNVIKVGSLSTATVRVPTHENGTSIFWEFATDSYDLGFGVYFEWVLSPPNQVSVQISESSDEEELEEEDAEHAGTVKGDIEKGSSRKKDTGPPLDEIIQVYRRDCHEEVYCGSHTYPGRGVYLLKFDNSYSLWRSKTVYYRVFYSR